MSNYTQTILNFNINSMNTPLLKPPIKAIFPIALSRATELVPYCKKHTCSLH